MNNIELAELVEFAEAEAKAEMVRAASQSTGFSLEQSDAYVAFFAPKVDILLFNRTFCLGIRQPATKEVVNDVIGKYRAMGLTGFGLQVSPQARPASLRSWIEEAGLLEHDSWIKMYRDARPVDLIPTDLRIEVVTPHQADVMGETACTGFNVPVARKDFLTGTVGMPGWTHYMAWDGDTPAAVAAMHIKGKVGWLGVAATLPQFRKRGAQGALMTRRIQDGINAGCEWLVTETGPDSSERPNPSYHNMLRTGFKLAYMRPNFMLPKN